jgi:hypothetical protein
MNARARVHDPVRCWFLLLLTPRYKRCECCTLVRVGFPLPAIQVHQQGLAALNELTGTFCRAGFVAVNRNADIAIGGYQSFRRPYSGSQIIERLVAPVFGRVYKIGNVVPPARWNHTFQMGLNLRRAGHWKENQRGRGLPAAPI